MLAPFDWVEPVQEIVKSPAKEILSDKKETAVPVVAVNLDKTSEKNESPAKEEPAA